MTEKDIATRLYNEPYSRFTNVIVHILHYPEYSAFGVGSGGLEREIRNWDYDDIEIFLIENLSMREMRLFLFQVDILYTISNTEKELAKIIFTYVKSRKDVILSHFNELFHLKTAS